tara:strand:+ start:767 stop:1273 length:507 start_codon:yes stop_codon:yes gene_type:complete
MEKNESESEQSEQSEHEGRPVVNGHEWKPALEGGGIYFMSQMPMEDGRTLREHNMEKEHKFPLGSLVEVEVHHLGGGYGEGPIKSDVDMKGTCRLFVVDQFRDCDGTPLYTLSDIPVLHAEYASQESFREKYFTTYCGGGYSEDSMKDLGVRQELFPTVAAWMDWSSR